MLYNIRFKYYIRINHIYVLYISKLHSIVKSSKMKIFCEFLNLVSPRGYISLLAHYFEFAFENGDAEVCLIYAELR